MSRDIEADPEELRHHAKNIQNLQHELSAALGAVTQVTDPDAFGMIGRPLAMICANFIDETTTQLRTAADTTNDHLQKVQTWAERTDDNEESIKALFATIEERK
ncbi:type VII secretion target [Amycolatopsis albispora]|uniref:ESX-1 secretion-associated protein n=1 Tax=Amycolatopsis albispora TaxID=1804986 RepID=A0A344LF76_9PSEU|nr:hypothetical protein [Amycolatopsis albispora]AXB46700.1 hypothetical protein A4R43_33195 [Amycolatopsis albispora]